MKEDKTKEIVQRSMVETSDEFMSNLMNSIEVEEQIEVSPLWSIRNVLISLAALCGVISFAVIKMLSPLDIDISILSRPAVYAVMFLTLLLLINHVMTFSA